MHNGALDLSYTGIADVNGEPWYVVNGTIDFNEDGMVAANGSWWYLFRSKVDTNFTGLALNEYGWWYINAGEIDLSYTGLGLNEYGWWYVNNGAVDLSYTGMAPLNYDWWYVTNGALDRDFTGMAVYAGGWYYLIDGYLDRSYEGLADNEYGWWYISNGTIDFTYNGLAEMNPKTGICHYYKLQDHNQNEIKNISHLVSDKNGERLWIAVMGGGVFYMDLKTGKINRCDTFESGKEYQENYNALHNRWVSSLLCTSNGKLYIGTYDGLGCLDISTMSFTSTYKKNRIFGGSIVLTLFEDEQGDIWAGTTKGLIHIDGKNGNSKTYTTHDGLPNNTICAIQSDRQHGLWISTNYGITNINLETGNFANYYAGNGLQGNEFSQNAACKGKEDYLIFGGINGITYFRPAEITAEVKQPEIKIADFYIHNKAVKKGTQSGKHEVIETAVQKANKFLPSALSLHFCNMKG